MPSLLRFPTPAAFCLQIDGAATVAEVKARAAAVTGVSATRLLIFRDGPVSDAEVLAEDSQLQLAIGESPLEGKHGAGDVPHLASLQGAQIALAERARRMKTAMDLYSKPESRQGLSTATAAFNAQSADSAQKIVRYQPLLENAELEAALIDMERRAEMAESRVKDLEKHLEGARRASSASWVATASRSDQPGVATAQSAAAAPAPAALSAALATLSNGAVAAQFAIDKPAADKPASALTAAARIAHSPPAASCTDSSTGDGSCEGCAGLLAAIRRERAADVDVPSHLAGAVDALRGALHRSLTLLSEDLYRDEVHCVSELLQNAGEHAEAHPLGCLPSGLLCSLSAQLSRGVQTTIRTRQMPSPRGHSTAPMDPWARVCAPSGLATMRRACWPLTFEHCATLEIRANAASSPESGARAVRAAAAF